MQVPANVITNIDVIIKILIVSAISPNAVSTVVMESVTAVKP